MSASQQVQGINLRHHALGEADRIVAVFSRELGLIRVVAKGSKKTTSRLGGRMDLLQCNDLQLHPGRNLDIVAGADTVRSFGGLRHDYHRLTYALFLAELLSGLLPERHPQPELYDLFAGTLAMLEVVERPDVLALWFQLQALDDLGYRLGLAHCHVCAAELSGQQPTVTIDLAMGALLCARCRLGFTEARPVRGVVVALLRDLRTMDVGTLTHQLPDTDVVLGAQRMLGEYFRRLIERELKSLKVILATL